ncbi:MAG TPA: PQQ-dependent sugar dehydrogenase [Actinomycetota bacterium]|nr:PQQ-dependent sugar dehydrogenase [Actinomycetota bacterium]
MTHGHLRRGARLVTAAVAVTMLVALGQGPAAGGGGGGGGAGVRAVTVADGLNGSAAFTFTPKGTIVYLERGTGEVRFLNPKTDFDRRFFDISAVRSDGERGALGVALHPNWPRKPFVYVFVTRSIDGNLQNQILRIRERNGRGVGFSTILSSPSPAGNHNGGRIAFGPGGKLFVVIGDGADPASSQDLTANLRGKVLRLNPDGSVPRTNPVIDGRRNRVFAFGIRNSFGFTFDPRTGDLWETENGPACNDEINLVRRGGNYAWGPNESCPNTNRDGPRPRRLPELNFSSTIGITGAAFCDGCGLPGREGDLLFGACCDGGVLRRVTLDAARDDVTGRPVTMLTAPGGSILSVEAGPNGSIYFSDSSTIYRLRAG